MLRLSLQTRGCAARRSRAPLDWARAGTGARSRTSEAAAGNRQAVAISSTTPIRRSDVESWLGCAAFTI